MSQFKTRIMVITGSLFFISCASLSPSKKDVERTPASIKAPVLTLTEEQKMDPLYLQTQADYNYSLGEAYSLDGSSQKAIEYFKSTLVYDPNATGVKLRLATEYVRSGQVSEALEITQKVVQQEPENERGRMLLAALYSSMRLYPKAIEQYAAVLAKNSQNSEASLYLGALYAEIEQYDKAIKIFEKLLQAGDEEQLHNVHYYLARVHIEKKSATSMKKAEYHLKKSIEAKPGFLEALLTLGAYYSSRDQDQKAVKLYEDYQKKHGPSARLAEILAQTYLEKEDFETAYSQYEILKSQGEERLKVKMKMALILAEKKIYDKSIEKLKEVLKEVPESDRARFYLAAIYEQTKQVDPAVREYERVPAESSYYNEAVVQGAYLLKNHDRLSEAIKYMEKALKKKQDEPAFYSLYASFLNEAKDPQKAATILQSASKKFPQNTQVLFFLGTIYDSLGEKDRVIDTMKSVIEIDPKHAQALNYVAYTWAEANINLSEAETYARKALQLEPHDGYILDTLGWVLYKQGNLVEAVKYLEAAYKIAPHVSVIAEHLGDIYVRQALVEKAKKMYHHALEVETEEDKADKIKVKITSIEVNSDRSPASAP